jgi:hypothetical protein
MTYVIKPVTAAASVWKEKKRPRAKIRSSSSKIAENVNHNRKVIEEAKGRNTSKSRNTKAACKDTTLDTRHDIDSELERCEFIL